MDFSNFTYHKSKVPSDSNKKDVFFEELKASFKKEILCSDMAKELFKNFNTDSVDSFIIDYCKRKADLTRYYHYYEELAHEVPELKFREDTEEVLKMIMQKKLFNLQLQWRAEQIKIKEISVCYDFVCWGRHVETCTFIPQITEEEIQLIQKFLLSDKVELSYPFWSISHYDLQDYDEMLRKEESGMMDNMPDWYDYYDTMMGTGSLLLLPDIRGNKESKYMDLGRELYTKRQKNKRNQAKKEQLSNAEPVKGKPSMPQGFEDMCDFSLKFESDVHMKKLFEIWSNSIKQNFESKKIHRLDYEEYLGILEEANEPVYSKGGLLWHEEIIQSALRYKSKIIAKELEIIYEEYLMFNNVGITKEKNKDKFFFNRNLDIRDMYIESILAGRESAGEPKDLNF